MRDGGGQHAFAQLVGSGLAVEGGVGDEHHVQVAEKTDSPGGIAVHPAGDGHRCHPDAGTEVEGQRGLVAHR